MTQMYHPYSRPRILTKRENDAIAAQAIKVRYPDDVTPVPNAPAIRPN